MAKKKEGIISESEVKTHAKKIRDIKDEISNAIVGQDVVVNSLVRGLVANGHVLMEGVPGIAKTLAIRVLGIVSGCQVKRVQFTVDLLPTDIIGLTIYREKKGDFEVVKGPVFSNFMIADEINRAPPKTQSALLEAMEEKQVTIGRETFNLDKPFFVMATQNPLEQSGVYNLPEAQVDRFLFKIIMKYPEREHEKKIMSDNFELRGLDSVKLKKVVNPKEIVKIQKDVKRIHLSEEVKEYISKIVQATRDKNKHYAKYISWGASPRASIGLFIASKAEALMNGRTFVKPQDVKAVVYDVLRHRIILGYEAESEEITSDDVIKKIINETPVS